MQLPLIMGLFLFLPAGTLRWWQGWLFGAVFFLGSLALTVYLASTDPKLLERRLDAGPRAEKEKSQKIIMVVAMMSFALTLILPATDHRLGWSHVPGVVVILGNLLIVCGLLGVAWVFRENTYGASTIQLAEGQKVISTGPYAIIRHPMYSATLVMLSGIPLALGSWWGLLTMITNMAAIAWRLLDEERFLLSNLAGYSDYARRVPYRLVPLVW
ncbi:MAG TPA: isoprenylcysteine carboxylmethyltransferase family protein [Steroidobacter sp.]